MKRSIYFLLALLTATGCCKVYCDGTELGVNFGKFKAVDTDTVLFVNYVPGGRQTKVVDTLRMQYPTQATDTFRSTLSYALSSAYDWKILLPSINKQFVLENFVLSTEKCTCGGQKYKAIKSFTVNGTQKEGLFVVLE